MVRLDLVKSPLVGKFHLHALVKCSVSSEPAITRSNLAKELLEQGVTYVQS